MTLTFPTQAEQAIAEFEARSHTVALTTIARKRGGERLPVRWPGGVIEFVFDDDTTLVIRGRGKNHTYEACLP